MRPAAPILSAAGGIFGGPGRSALPLPEVRRWGAEEKKGSP